MSIRNVANIYVADQKVIVRADLNVPMKDGVITDLTRIERFAPTVQNLCERGASVVILTHLGRPKDESDRSLSVRPIAKALGEILGKDVQFSDTCIGPEAEQITSNLAAGEVVVLENVRFHKDETLNKRSFAQQLAAHGDVYVNDAFSCSHRAHASTHAITKFLPAFAGPSLSNEIMALSGALETPKRPVAAIVGGAKVSTKIDVLTNLVDKIDYLIIGGGMANTFLAAKGYSMGKSLVEQDAILTAKDILELAASKDCEIVLPIDLVVAEQFAANSPSRTVKVDSVPEGMMALDVGVGTCCKITSVLEVCKTLLWNGPLGASEIEPFGEGTFSIAKSAVWIDEMIKLKTIAGGGDTVAALKTAGVADRFSYISTAGGAFLEWMEGKALPGVEALKNQNNKMEVA